MHISGFEYLVVAVDYFSKYIEAKPLRNPTEENVLDFFHDSILCRFRVPREVVTNHGTQFSKTFTSVAHPQGYGQAKVANKLVLQALKKNLEGTSKKWVD